MVQLRIALIEYAPRIWRRLRVPGDIRLGKLHTVFQAAMGWDDCHLHCFEIDDKRYGMTDEDSELDEIDEEDVVFVDVINAHSYALLP